MPREPAETPSRQTGRLESIVREIRRFLLGLAVTYSPTSWDAVPSALRRLTVEFGMGSCVSLVL